MHRASQSSGINARGNSRFEKEERMSTPRTFSLNWIFAFMARHPIENIMQDRGSDRLAAYRTTNFTHSTISSVLENSTANLTIPQGCQVVRLEEMEFLPWDNPDNIVSAEVEHIARRVKDLSLIHI